MVVLAIIRHGNNLLLVNSCKSKETIIWTLPNTYVSEGAVPQIAIKEKFKIYDVDIDFYDVFYEGTINGQAVICFTTRLNQYSLSSNNNTYCWVDPTTLDPLLLDNEFSPIFTKILEEQSISNSTNNEITAIVDDIASSMNLRVEKICGFRSYIVFVKNDFENYCPYIFSLQYNIDNSTSAIDSCISWPLTQMIADGDKTDLYVLFSSLMSILLKCIFQKNVLVEYFQYFSDAEINAASIVFNDSPKLTNLKDLLSLIKVNFLFYLYSLFAFDRFWGSFSLLQSTNIAEYDLTKILNKDTNYTSISREEHRFYGNFRERTYLLHIANKAYDRDKLIENHCFDIVDGIDGKIVCQKSFENHTFNFISNKKWLEIQDTISSIGDNDYSIICQENHLYVLYQEDILIFEGDFSEYHVDEEKTKIQTRQVHENSILLLSRKFKWKYPISANRFENLIADLIETDPRVEAVRLVGPTNNPDGGRDLLIYKYCVSNQHNDMRPELIIGQCKAFQKTVNKSNVTDIRDMLDYYSANGFILAVSSQISTPLIDYLCKLKERYYVIWYTEREIFQKLRQYPQIAETYQDIIEIIEA